MKIKPGKKKVTILHLYDPSNGERFRNLMFKNYLRGVDCAVIGYDINNRESYEKAINYWYPQIKSEIPTCDLIYLIGNKMDLYKKDESIIEEAMNFAQSKKLGFFTISCKTDQGIWEFFEDLVINLVNK